MTAGELIEALQKVSTDTLVYAEDNEYGVMPIARLAFIPDTYREHPGVMVQWDTAYLIGEEVK